MRGRVGLDLTDRARILSYDPADVDDEDVGTNRIGETTVDVDDDGAVLEEDVPTRFKSETTAYVREESGERTRRPAVATFYPDALIREGRVVTFDVDGHSTEYEVAGVSRTDDRHGSAVSIEAELRRAD